MSSGTETYTEGNSTTITGVANNGKKACFSSTDVAGNTAYTATAALAIAGGAPSTTWTPANNGYLTALSGSITLVFGSDVYSDSGCATELTNTTADNAVTLGTTNNNNNIATTVTYTAASNTITITPDSNLSDNTTYYAGVTNAWYYQNGACAQGTAESISFTTDATAPTLTISTVSGGYVNAAEDNSGVTVSGTTTGADSTSDVDLSFTNGSNTTTISNITVSSNTWTTTLTLTQLTTLTEGTISISGTVDDRAGNTSTATQSFVYDITAPTVTLSGQPTNTNNTTTLAVTVAGTDITHYKHKTVTGASCTASGYGSETAIATSITDDISTLSDGSIILCVLGKDTAGNWQTTASSASWTKDTSTPTLSIAAVSGGYVNASEDDSGVTISGTTTGADIGSDVDLTFTNGSNTTTISDITVSSNTWTTTLTLTQLTTLSEGTIAISGTVDDTAGNTSTATQSFVYDITAPTVTASVGGTNDVRTVKGVDTDTGTVWKYKVIDAGTSCNASAMTHGTSSYTENTDQSVGVSANGKKVCFSSTDVAGNVGYQATTTLTVTAPLSATVGLVPTGSVHAKNITISSVTTGAAVQYNLITNSTCNATNYGSGGTAVTLSGNAGTVTVTHESDNNKYLCFKVTKVGFSDQYFGSAQITGIDDTAPIPPSSIIGPGLFGNDTTPSFTVTMAEAAGSVVLYLDSACTTVASAAVSVTDTSAPYTVSVTANALSGDGERTFYAEHTDVATHQSGCSSVFASYTLDTVLPVVTTTVGGTDLHRKISAVDDDSGTTTMRYNLISGSAVCGASTMGIRALSYIEGQVITITGSRYNNKKMCFSSQDAAGNTAYAATAPLTVTGTNSSHGSSALFAGEYIHFDEVNEQSKKEHLIHRPGDSHPEIKQVQILLNRTSCKVSETGPGSIGEETEFFGAKTHSAIFCFQKEVGINETGVFDPPTRYALLGIPTGEVKAPEAAYLVQGRITALKDRLLTLLQELRSKLIEKETNSEA